jgi:peptidoglycan hydrolase-like protein with peptidoglycan-binding domain
VAWTDLTTTVLTEGTLGFAPTDPVVNGLTGTYTALPATGTTISPGQVLYRVDDLPVVLMAGALPAWRSFGLGMSDGPDVAQLQADLIELGFARGLLATPTGHFGLLTTYAVERWQSAYGLLPTGQVDFGQIIFLDGSVLIGASNALPGQPATPGDVPYQVTTTKRIVTVPLSPNLPDVNVGEGVSIVLPDNTATAGTISRVGPAPPNPGSGSQSSSTGGTSQGDPQQTPQQTPQPAAIATVVPTQPGATGDGSGIAVQVSLTSQSVRHVLAVPIAALLALEGGGYGVEVVEPSGVHQLVGVATGTYTGSQVQIRGVGIGAGTRVVVSQ